MNIYDLKFKRENGKMIFVGEDVFEENQDGTWSISKPSRKKPTILDRYCNLLEIRGLIGLAITFLFAMNIGVWLIG